MKSKEKKKDADILAINYFLKKIRELQLEVEILRSELQKRNRLPSAKIGIAFITFGALALILSILKNSQILAFIGLGLTFWGALFLFIMPVKFVKSELLHSASISTYSTIDRIINDLKLKGRSYYIPPYPKDVYLPEHLKGLKEMTVFLSADTNSFMPSIEDMAKSKFLLGNPNGICISPPGLGLLIQYEKELRTDLTKMELDNLLDVLPSLITESIPLAKEAEIEKTNGKIKLKILDSIYNDLYTKHGLKSVHLLGCPLVSSIACAIAKSTGKIVTIERGRTSLEGELIEIWYKLIGD